MTIAPPLSNKTDFSKVEAKLAQPLFDRYSAQLVDLKPLLTSPATTSLAFHQSLIAAGKLREAITFLAYALPKKEAVAWAAHCAKIAGGKGEKLPAPLPMPQLSAVQAAQKWVLAQTDETRRATYPIAETASFGTPAGACALGAFLSGGSVGPPDIPTPIPPPEHACAHAVANSIFLAGLVNNPKFAKDKYTRFLTDGFAIASGKLPAPQLLEN